MKTDTDILIIGGGLAGLACGIHLSGMGRNVTIIEKALFPRHKVCGEYISNEILPYLGWLGVDVEELKPARISRFEFSSASGDKITATLPLGGFGISRYALDDLLYRKATANGCKVIQGAVRDVSFKEGVFTVTADCGVFTSRIAIGAYGKRSNIDQSLSREFVKKRSPWLAVKAHYKGDFPDDVVALHNFKGGYCGVSKVENGIINICYLADYDTFKRYRNIEEYQQQVLRKNPYLERIFENSTMVFERPLTISQVSFDRKYPVENHMLMVGDTAGLIHPLCGNGMAIAFHSAKLAAELVLDFLAGKLSRQTLEVRYAQDWQKQFGRRMRTGRLLAKALRNGMITTALMQATVLFPALMPKIIRQTHGEPIVCLNC